MWALYQYRRKALMTHPDLSAILGREKSHLEGGYFVEHRIFTLQEINQKLSDQIRHNSPFIA
jgi:hypothetical protein